MKGAGAKILVVDDEASIRFALTEALRAWDYEPLQAKSVAEAKEVITQEEPGLALLDIDLPDGSGLDVLTYIKEQQPDAVAIMVTGNVNVPNVITALRGGVRKAGPDRANLLLRFAAPDFQVH